MVVYLYRDTSLRDLRASSGDLARIGSSSEMLNSMVNRETDTNHQNQRDNLSSDAPRFQSGVLRTNCIDCLDRTNVAQYAYGLQALGRQLHAMGLTDVPKVDPDSSIAAALMDMYQSMGDALAQQYGGSAAHNTVWNIYMIPNSCNLLDNHMISYICAAATIICILVNDRCFRRGRENGKQLHNQESS